MGLGLHMCMVCMVCMGGGLCGVCCVLCVVCVVCLFPSLVVSLTTTCITSSTFRIVINSDNSECKVKYVLTIGVGG